VPIHRGLAPGRADAFKKPYSSVRASKYAGSGSIVHTVLTVRFPQLYVVRPQGSQAPSISACRLGKSRYRVTKLGNATGGSMQASPEPSGVVLEADVLRLGPDRQAFRHDCRQGGGQRDRPRNLESWGPPDSRCRGERSAAGGTAWDPSSRLRLGILHPESAPRNRTAPALLTICRCGAAAWRAGATAESAFAPCRSSPVRSFRRAVE